MRPCIVLKLVYNQTTYTKTDHWFTLFDWNYWPVALYRKSWKIEEEPGNQLHGSKPENKKKAFKRIITWISPMTHAEKGLLLDLPPKRLTFWLVEDKIK